MDSRLVSTDWLARNLDASDVVVLDASWHLPTQAHDARAEYLQEHIPGARFFDLDAVSDRKSPLPHMLPQPESFARDMAELGIGHDATVIAYDSPGLFSAARCWWMFRVFGHEKVAVLDGGLAKWKRENRPLARGDEPAVSPGDFSARLDSGKVKTLRDVRLALETGAFQLADGRSPARFAGREGEPRAGMRQGHMPGARNVHYARLLRDDGTLKSASELRKIFADAGVDPERPVITTCGSGVVAAILSLALDIIGCRHHGLYDGSWSEWGQAPDVSVVKGED